MTDKSEIYVESDCMKQNGSIDNKAGEVLSNKQNRENISSANLNENFSKSSINKGKLIEYAKRYLFLIVGLVIMAFGVAFSVNAQLGTSPVSSIPAVTATLSGATIGVTTMIVNIIIVLIQIPVMRKKFKLIRLLQIPVCIVFGLLIDLASLCISSVMPQEYWAQWLICIVGIILVALGVSFEMTANVATLAGEGLVQALCSVCHKVKFNYMKVIVDVSFVAIAVALSFIFLKRLDGVREGTIAAAIFVGLVAKLFNKIVRPLGNKFINSERSKKENI